ncbi:MAG: outer membrane beta-barrel protein [Treponema sp.]|nr:outer membrane beta-barrel protein [Treponema sp.]
MKKLLAVTMFAAVIGTAAFAEAPAFALSAGAGGLFSYNFGGGVMNGDDGVSIPYLGGGFFAFFDATYAEVNVGMDFGSATLKGEGAYADYIEDTKMSATNLNIGVLGKYPISLGSVVLFPAIGINYRVTLAVKDEDGNEMDEPGDFSALSFLFGGGLDYGIGEKLYLRGEVLYSIRLASKFESDQEQGDAKYNLGHGPTVKVAVGYKF